MSSESRASNSLCFVRKQTRENLTNAEKKESSRDFEKKEGRQPPHAIKRACVGLRRQIVHFHSLKHGEPLVSAADPVSCDFPGNRA